ncbi:GGDEF domain-containing protein [Mesorhizobium sp. SB112]|uniref:GGDEF domain-containing protein n=1 Tax=Mesorhizobium sp. SB112 TaxID=3151853 RepID=UPI0032652280
MGPVLALDFLTLYVVIFLKSLTVTVIWTAFAYRYHPHVAAQHWLAGSVISMIGGSILTIQGNQGSLVPAILGNAIVIYGFCQSWIGIRRFYGKRGGQLTAVILTLVSVFAMIFFHDQDRLRSMVYATGQMTVMVLSIIYLLKPARQALGAGVASVAFAIAAVGQLSVIGGNFAVLTGAMTFPSFYQLASYALLCTIFSGMVWNFGFAFMAIDKLQAELARLSETDDLTGIGNRRALRAALLDEHRRSTLSAIPYSVALIDLNKFKQLNDKYGHAAGDTALVHLAGILSSSVRAGDFVARLGGDEFCILMPETSKYEVVESVEKIHDALARTPVVISGEEICLSASIGVADWKPKGRLYADGVLAEADKDLYRRKAHDSRRRVKNQNGLYVVP